MNGLPDLANTARVLDLYDKVQSKRAIMAADQSTNAYAVWLELDRAALELLRGNFAHETRDRNAPDQAVIAPLDFIRQCVADWRAANPRT
jgi:hypothetical protein